MEDNVLRAALQSELDRLGLKLEDFPGGGMSGERGALKEWLLQLRSLEPGVGWRDVVPDLPAHWEPGRPETWTTPYHPLGPCDYPELPAGPAVHVHWPEGVESSPLEEFVISAREAGWPVHGAGLIEQLRSTPREFHAHIVLDRGTDEETFDEFLAWIDEQPGVEIAVVTRAVGQKYLE
jgi:hypothetical protein